ncbi:MAG: hypothetical protein IIZ92_07185, partial [Aquincola sp.]|nr:hypothetical protein [Aquincola sp.]
PYVTIVKRFLLQAPAQTWRVRVDKPASQVSPAPASPSGPAAAWRGGGHRSAVKVWMYRSLQAGALVPLLPLAGIPRSGRLQP